MDINQTICWLVFSVVFSMALVVVAVAWFRLSDAKSLLKETHHIQSLLKSWNSEDVHLPLLKARSGKVAHPYQVGKNYFIRTVTHHHTGKLVRVTAKDLVLVDAAWIADDGRFMNALSEGKINEVEPFPDGLEVIVGRGSVIDAVEWLHPLPRAQK